MLCAETWRTHLYVYMGLALNRALIIELHLIIENASSRKCGDAWNDVRVSILVRPRRRIRSSVAFRVVLAYVHRNRYFANTERPNSCTVLWMVCLQAVPLALGNLPGNVIQQREVNGVVRR